MGLATWVWAAAHIWCLRLLVPITYAASVPNMYVTFPSKGLLIIAECVQGYTTPGGFSYQAVKPIALAKVCCMSCGMRAAAHGSL